MQSACTRANGILRLHTSRLWPPPRPGRNCRTPPTTSPCPTWPSKEMRQQQHKTHCQAMRNLHGFGLLVCLFLLGLVVRLLDDRREQLPENRYEAYAIVHSGCCHTPLEPSWAETLPQPYMEMGSRFSCGDPRNAKCNEETTLEKLGLAFSFKLANLSVASGGG